MPKSSRNSLGTGLIRQIRKCLLASWAVAESGVYIISIGRHGGFEDRRRALSPAGDRYTSSLSSVRIVATSLAVLADPARPPRLPFPPKETVHYEFHHCRGASPTASAG